MVKTVKLISEQITADEYGNSVAVETARDVIGEIKSIGQQEFFKAREHKLQAQSCAVICPFDYAGESVAEIDGVRHKIYRTYLKGDNLELYLAAL